MGSGDAGWLKIFEGVEGLIRSTKRLNLESPRVPEPNHRARSRNRRNRSRSTTSPEIGDHAQLGCRKGASLGKSLVIGTSKTHLATLELFEAVAFRGPRWANDGVVKARPSGES